MSKRSKPPPPAYEAIEVSLPLFPAFVSPDVGPAGADEIVVVSVLPLPAPNPLNPVSDWVIWSVFWPLPAPVDVKLPKAAAEKVCPGFVTLKKLPATTLLLSPAACSTDSVSKPTRVWAADWSAERPAGLIELVSTRIWVYLWLSGF